jgi:hypothetical protein
MGTILIAVDRVDGVQLVLAAEALARTLTQELFR